LVEKSEGKKLLGKPGCRWENNIRTDLKETGWKYVDYSHIHVAKDMDQWWALITTVMNLRAP